MSQNGLTREGRQRRNREEAKLRSKELVLDLMMRKGSCCGFVAMVQPHASGGGLGDISVVEIVREFFAVAPATDHEGEGENRENTRLEELKDCQLERGELGSRVRLGGAVQVRDGEGSGQVPLAPRTVQLRSHKYRLAGSSNCCKKRLRSAEQLRGSALEGIGHGSWSGLERVLS